MNLASVCPGLDVKLVLQVRNDWRVSEWIKGLYVRATQKLIYTDEKSTELGEIKVENRKVKGRQIENSKERKKVTGDATLSDL